MDFLTIFLSIIALISVGVVIGMMYWLFVQVRPLWHHGGPFVPTPSEKIGTMMRLADIQPGEIVIDLGSGDGRLLFEAAGEEAKEVVGYEINGRLVKQSRARAEKLGYGDRMTVKKESMWDADVSRADVVFVYQISYAMKRLADKLRTELKPGARVVSNGFRFKDWDEAKEENNVYLYIQK